MGDPLASFPARGGAAGATADLAAGDALDRPAGRLPGAQRGWGARRKSAVARPAATACDGPRLPVGKNGCAWCTKFRRMKRALLGNALVRSSASLKRRRHCASTRRLACEAEL